MSSATGKRGATMTILGLGSLLSERSARTTFPSLSHFRLVQLHGYRRVFAHTPALFVRRGIADARTLEMASLSAEECEGCGFVCTAFEVVDEGMDAFNEREEEFELRLVSFSELNGDGSNGDGSADASSGRGSCVPGTDGRALLCVGSTDGAYVSRWGRERWEREYVSRGLSTIWQWPKGSALKPCAAYLRHCVLAARRSVSKKQKKTLFSASS
jgi:hypothetical protein|tara:strand:- start:743 stop:1384 length:642 start_codon:yes stop_codon:yes gene_type:complete